VFELTPSDYLTDNEIAAAALADEGGVFNPQQQFPVRWPSEPSVALAWLDQLVRDERVPRAQANDLRRALNRSARRLDNERSDEELAATLTTLAAGLSVTGHDALTTRRAAGLTATVGDIAARLR
jgi:hypothetical protein